MSFSNIEGTVNQANQNTGINDYWAGAKSDTNQNVKYMAVAKIGSTTFTKVFINEQEADQFLVYLVEKAGSWEKIRLLLLSTKNADCLLRVLPDDLIQKIIASIVELNLTQ